jgi:hypothetical protein
MTNTKPNILDVEEAVRKRILERAQEITREFIARLRTVEGDLHTGNHLGALGALAGIEAEFTTLRSILLLLR